MSSPRAYLKNAFCKMCVTICGRFRLNEGGVAGYANRMRAKYTAKWGVQIMGMIFQTRSSQTRKVWFDFSCFNTIFIDNPHLFHSLFFVPHIFSTITILSLLCVVLVACWVCLLVMHHQFNWWFDFAL